MFGYFVLFQIVFFFKIAMLLEFNVLCFMRTVEKWLDLLNTNYDADNTIDSFWINLNGCDYRDDQLNKTFMTYQNC